MAAWIVSGVLGFMAGGAFIWLFKDRIQMMVMDGNRLAAKLHAKADAISKAIK